MSIFHTASISTWASLFSLLVLCVTNPIAFATDFTKTELLIAERPVSVWHWQPQGTPKSTIIFSHGAASSPLKYTQLIEYWQRNGYEVIAPLHVDSTDHPEQKRFSGMATWTARLQDLQVLADTYGKNGYVAAGHSYGALVSLVKGGVKGKVTPGVSTPLADPRVSMVLAFSPPGAIPGFISKDNFQSLSVPALIQTGTEDVPPGPNLSWQVHLDAFIAAPAGGNRYALVLDGVDHYFGGAIGRPELPGPQQRKQLTMASEISVRMLDAFSAQQMDAQNALNNIVGNGPMFELSTK